MINLKKSLIIVLIIMNIGAGLCYGVEKIYLSEPIDFNKKMLANTLFLKWCESFDVENGFIFFLDKDFSMIFKVDLKSGKLIKTISSLGQGKFELQSCDYIKVKNNRIYILDIKFQGIKIFDTEGNGISEIKTSIAPGWGTTVDIDSSKDEIYMGTIDKRSNTRVSVYEKNGKKNRSIINLKDKNISRLDKSWYYTIKLDNTGNIYIIYYMSRQLEKYDGSGKLLWQKHINNSILDRYQENEVISEPSIGRISISNRCIFGIDVTPLNNIIIGHIGGGCIFNSDGELKYELAVSRENKVMNLFVLKIIDNQLINLTNFGEKIVIFPLKAMY